uniref:Uncharacterized protein n=1 Tax=Pseudictyota dubia TaxID=2749911 RepID=A0A7R9ZH41_9STRA|mmetsp:Transcript_7201/g.13069  ORF Transcript_7201/g.13069 Transcript_7201/m.13069 type:complete len:147 (+) Transcript_7201:619-1059(+)
MDDEGIAGPIFVSIGDKEKLNKFLDLNPYISRDMAFVDDMKSFDAYKAVGFGSFTEADKEEIKGVKLPVPDLGGFGGWWNYLTNVMNISPVPDDMKMGEFPEGVLRLGGTFVVDGRNVIYQWNDKLPGDHPIPEEVLSVTKASVTE